MKIDTPMSVTIIPAAPDWWVCELGVDEYDNPCIYKNPIIAWEIEREIHYYVGMDGEGYIAHNPVPICLIWLEVPEVYAILSPQGKYLINGQIEYEHSEEGILKALLEETEKVKKWEKETGLMHRSRPLKFERK
jgi:hypothetical protein